MKSILLRFPDKVVRYIRGKGSSERNFSKLVNNAKFFGATGWCRDSEQDFNGMGYHTLHSWNEVSEVIVENCS